MSGICFNQLSYSRQEENKAFSNPLTAPSPSLPPPIIDLFKCRLMSRIYLMGCYHPTTSEELNLHKERINWVRGRVGGNIHADGCLGPLKTRPMVFRERSIPHPLLSVTNPLVPLQQIFPFRSLLGERFCSLPLCSGKTTIEKCKAGAWQQLL